jgi:hypothetical protein
MAWRLESAQNVTSCNYDHRSVQLSHPRPIASAELAADSDLQDDSLPVTTGMRMLALVHNNVHGVMAGNDRVTRSHQDHRYDPGSRTDCQLVFKHISSSVTTASMPHCSRPDFASNSVPVE